MPSGVYTRTKEHKRKIAESNKGKIGTIGVYIRTNKHGERISEGLKKIHYLPKNRFKKGENNPNWKGGKCIEVICQYCGKQFKVKPYIVNKGFGKYCSTKCFHLSTIGKKLPLQTEESKRNLRELAIKRLSSGKQVYKNTLIEIAIENELKRVNLNYQKQVGICKVGVVDFFLPEYDIIIECDGDYFHKFPKVKQRDATKDLVWMFNNYKVFRFWEHEINESPKNCIKAVLRYIKLNNYNSIKLLRVI